MNSYELAECIIKQLEQHGLPYLAHGQRLANVELVDRLIAANLAEGRDESAARIAALEARASTLEDAAFHFQTCRICRADGEFGRKTCIDGQAFDAFFRGEGPLMAAQGAPTRAEGRPAQETHHVLSENGRWCHTHSCYPRTCGASPEGDVTP